MRPKNSNATARQSKMIVMIGFASEYEVAPTMTRPTLTKRGANRSTMAHDDTKNDTNGFTYLLRCSGNDRAESVTPSNNEKGF
jgi:hypothetical protein